jgi:hypothetical protein
MAGGVFSQALLYGMTIRESANDGSDFTNPAADYRRLFLGEDGILHLKDSAGTVTDLAAGAVATDAIWDAAGDLAVGSGANTAARLAIGAVGGALTRINGAVAWNSGTSFPGSKATGDRYYRSDIGAEYTWDGTNWVSMVPYYYPIDTAADQGISASTILHRAGIPRPPSDIFVYGFYTDFFVSGGTALSASHKWVGTVSKTGGATSTSMGTITIDSGASSSWREATTLTINALITTATYVALEINWVKTGTPGPLYAHVQMVYRNVAT